MKRVSSEECRGGKAGWTKMDGGTFYSSHTWEFLRDREELCELVFLFFYFIFVASDRFRLVRRKIANEIRVRFSYIVSLSRFYRLCYYECSF